MVDISRDKFTSSVGDSKDLTLQRRHVSQSSSLIYTHKHIYDRCNGKLSWTVTFAITHWPLFSSELRCRWPTGARLFRNRRDIVSRVRSPRLRRWPIACSLGRRFYGRNTLRRRVLSHRSIRSPRSIQTLRSRSDSLVRRSSRCTVPPGLRFLSLWIENERAHIETAQIRNSRPPYPDDSVSRA